MYCAGIDRGEFSCDGGGADGGLGSKVRTRGDVEPRMLWGSRVSYSGNIRLSRKHSRSTKRRRGFMEPKNTPSTETVARGRMDGGQILYFVRRHHLFEFGRRYKLGAENTSRVGGVVRFCSKSGKGNSGGKWEHNFRYFGSC